jgi:2'-5' RNA ligase
MRLFTGIDLPNDVRERLDVLITHLRGTAHIKWSPAYNLHITTKFIGEWPAERLDELIDRLHQVPRENRIDICVQGVGWFPDPRRPRVFWAGIQASPSLEKLARDTEQTLAEIGVAVENRPFSPHLTLARIKDPVPLHGLQKAVSELKSTDFGRFTAPSFYLYRSQLGAGGSVYTKLQEFPLPTK